MAELERIGSGLSAARSLLWVLPPPHCAVSAHPVPYVQAPVLLGDPGLQEGPQFVASGYRQGHPFPVEADDLVPVLEPQHHGPFPPFHIGADIEFVSDHVHQVVDRRTIRTVDIVDSAEERGLDSLLGYRVGGLVAPGYSGSFRKDRMKRPDGEGQI